MADIQPTAPAPKTVTPKTVTSPSKKRRRGGAGRLFNLLLLIGIIAAIALFVRAEMQRRDTNTKLQQTEQELETIKKSTNASGDEVAKQVLDKARQHIDIPASPAPTVATIVDVDKLKATNDFYKNAQNGDNLIITPTRAILFRADDNNGQGKIIDVVPVVVNPNASPTPVGSTPVPSGPAATTPATGAAPAVGAPKNP